MHTPVHASWLNQVEIYFSLIQRKVLTPNDFADLQQVELRLRLYEELTNRQPQPFNWQFTKYDLFDLLQRHGYGLPVIVSPHAYVSLHATVDAGSIVMHGAVVNASAVVGRNCILNSQSLVEHDAVIGDHCHVATAAAVNSGVRIGSATFIGSNSTLVAPLVIGPGAYLGAGSVITKTVPPDALALGRARQVVKEDWAKKRRKADQG